jgi:hypothetical protein
MNEMVERVARAIGATHERDAPVLVALEELARAAIGAMREPTQSMIEAGRLQELRSEIWRVMIDEALVD